MKPDQARFLNFLKGIQQSSIPPAKPLSVFETFDKEAAGQNVVFLQTPAAKPLRSHWEIFKDQMKQTKPNPELDAEADAAAIREGAGDPFRQRLRDIYKSDDPNREVQRDYDDEIDGSYR